MTTRPSDQQIRDVMLDLAHRRGRGKTYCPSEVARALAPDWRPLMDAVRAEGERLVASGHLRATQRGASVDLALAKGPIRFGLA